MAYQMVATAVTLNDLEGHSPVANVFTCNPSNICAALYTILTDSVLAWFLWISRASCQQLSQKTAIIFQLTQRVARFLCNTRTSCCSCFPNISQTVLPKFGRTFAVCPRLVCSCYKVIAPVTVTVSIILSTFENEIFRFLILKSKKLLREFHFCLEQCFISQYFAIHVKSFSGSGQLRSRSFQSVNLFDSKATK